MSSLANRAFNRILYASYLNFYWESNKLRNNISPSRSILIFSNPRGGSTWLAELLNTLPNSAIIWEPLRRYKVKEFTNLDFYWHQPIPEDADWPEAYHSIKRLLNMEIKSRNIYFKNNLLKFPFSNYVIHKFCYGNLLLPWMVKNFDVNPILLIRHPCAVVASQMKHESWNGVKSGQISYDIEDFRYNEEYLKFKDILKIVKAPEEHLAATWSITTLNTIMHPKNDIKWITLSYESLYRNFDEEIDRIFKRLGLPIPEKIYEAKLNPSKTTKTYSVENIHTGDQLSQWKRSLSKKQVDNILGITREFGINFYDDSPEPDYSQLYKQSP